MGVSSLQRRRMVSKPPPTFPREQKETMRQIATVLYVLALVAVVVGVDILFFRHHFWERLMVNVGIVLVFLAFALRFLKRA